MKKLLLILALVPALALGDAVIRGAGTSNQAKVNTLGSMQVNEGPSARVTYIASAAGLATTAAYSLSIEAGSSIGFKVSQICVGVVGATAAEGYTIAVQRRTTASSAGTVVNAEATATPSVSRMDQGSGTWPGIVRLTGTLGTAGAVLDQWSYYVPVVATGAGVPVCKQYGLNGEQLPTVGSGTTNGLSVLVTPGTPTGGLAFGSISVTLITE